MAKEKKAWRHCYKDSCLGYSLEKDEYGYSFLCSNCKTKLHIAIKRRVAIRAVVDNVVCNNCGITQAGASKRWD